MRKRAACTVASGIIDITSVMSLPTSLLYNWPWTSRSRVGSDTKTAARSYEARVAEPSRLEELQVKRDRRRKKKTKNKKTKNTKQKKGPASNPH